MNIRQIVTQPAFIHLLKLNYIGWVIFFVVFNCYCVFWREYGVKIGFELNDSLFWFFKEWGAWVLLSPILLLALENPKGKLPQWLNIVIVSTLFLIAVFTARIYLNNGEYAQEAFTVVVVLFPKYLSGFSIYMILWYFIKTTNDTQSHLVDNSQQEAPPSLVIEHNGLKVNIQLDNILSLKTAGNYIEIDDGERTYLKRTTLKSMLGELPEQYFVQVHRSYAINHRKLNKLTHLENGSGMAILSNQQTIPVSKRYKSHLKSIAVSSGNLTVPTPI